MRIGVSTKRGPISTSDVSGGPWGCEGSFSTICPVKPPKKKNCCESVSSNKKTLLVSKKKSCLTWKFRNQILESRRENVRTWSMNGLALRACGGTPNICVCVPTSNDEKLHESRRDGTLTCVNSSFVSRPHSVSSNAASKLKIPRLPLRQFPVILSSSIVCTFCTCSLMLGPFGVLAAQRYRSSCRRASKYSVLLHECKSASSGSKLRWFFESSFESKSHCC
jgi:hypothetical protein